MSKGMNSLAAGAAVAWRLALPYISFSGKKRRTMKKLKRSAGKSNEGHGRPGRQCVLHDEITPKTRRNDCQAGFVFPAARGNLPRLYQWDPNCSFSGNT